MILSPMMLHKLFWKNQTICLAVKDGRMLAYSNYFKFAREKKNKNYC